MSKGLIFSVIAVYFIVLIIISRLTSRKADNDSFFLGNKQSPWYIVAFGMIGASLSGITFISIPGMVGKASFGYMQGVFGYFLGYMVISFVLMPIYYKMNVVSIYTYLEKRFGFFSYKLGSAFFLVSRIIGASIRLLLVANVLQEIMFKDFGIPFELTVIFSIALIWLYTNKGGIKTIIWTDTLQTLFMLVSLGLTMYLIINALDFSEEGVFATLGENGFSKLFFFDDFNAKNYFWKFFVGGMFITIGMTGIDQDMMQKNLSCKNIKEAQKNMVTFSVVLVAVNFLFLVLGGLLFLYANQQGIDIPGKTDLLFSSIAMQPGMGIAVGVLFLLGLIAAAYSSADSALTSLTTSFCIDFLNIKKHEKEKQERMRKFTHIGMSGVLFLVIILLKYTSDHSAIMNLIFFAGFTYGPLIALFFFGIMTKRDLIDKLVYIPIFLGIGTTTLFYLNSVGFTGDATTAWFGKYAFGWELILMNAIICFIFLWFFSVKREADVAMAK